MKKLLFLLCSFIFVSTISAQQNENYWPEQSWAVGMAVRSASVPFKTDTNSVSTLVPLFFMKVNIFI